MTKLKAEAVFLIFLFFLENILFKFVQNQLNLNIVCYFKMGRICGGDSISTPSRSANFSFTNGSTTSSTATGGVSNCCSTPSRRDCTDASCLIGVIVVVGVDIVVVVVVVLHHLVTVLLAQ